MILVFVRWKRGMTLIYPLDNRNVKKGKNDL